LHPASLPASLATPVPTISCFCYSLNSHELKFH
jgi:hypothetical protein